MTTADPLESAIRAKLGIPDDDAETTEPAPLALNDDHGLKSLIINALTK